MRHLLTHENLTSEPIGKGDAGIILKPDGTWKVFNCAEIGADGKLTPEQEEQGLKLMALSVALSVPQAMTMLLELAADPAISGAGVVDLSGVSVN